jgi:Fic family protein
MLLPFDSRDLERWTDELDAWAQRLDERVLPRRWAGRLRRALEAEAVAASTSMEGVPVTVDDTLRILAGDPPEHVSQKDQALVRGYREAMTYVQRRADDGRLQWNRELVVAVQDRVLAGDFGAGAGRLREGAAWVRNSQSGDVVFEPPDGGRVPALVDELCRTIEAADWHPAIAAAWAHVAVAAIHPFKDGNGRTARVLASLAMYRGGFKHPAFTNLEEYWGRHPASYYEAFSVLGAAFEPAADVTRFVISHLIAQVAQVLELAVRQSTEGMLWTTLENLLEDRGLPPRLANALYDSFFLRPVTSAYYGDLIDASQGTARNDLQAASAAGLLDAVGRTRGRRYVRGPALLQSVASSLGIDDFDFERIVQELVRRANALTEFPLAQRATQEQLPGFGDVR